jgi:hypothetical protein
MRETNFSGVRGIQLPCGLAVVASAFALSNPKPAVSKSTRSMQRGGAFDFLEN